MNNPEGIQSQTLNYYYEEEEKGETKIQASLSRGAIIEHVSLVMLLIFMF